MREFELAFVLEETQTKTWNWKKKNSKHLVVALFSFHFNFSTTFSRRFLITVFNNHSSIKRNIEIRSGVIETLTRKGLGKTIF